MWHVYICTKLDQLNFTVISPVLMLISYLWMIKYYLFVKTSPYILFYYIILSCSYQILFFNDWPGDYYKTESSLCSSTELQLLTVCLGKEGLHLLVVASLLWCQRGRASGQLAYQLHLEVPDVGDEICCSHVSMALLLLAVNTSTIHNSYIIQTYKAHLPKYLYFLSIVSKIILKFEKH